MSERTHLINVVGVVGGEVFGRRAANAVANADVLVGSSRHLARVEGSPEAVRLELAGPLAPLIDQINEYHARGRRVCVLSSGDPGFFGIVRVLEERLGAPSLRVHPAPSSVSLAFGSQGWHWDDAVVVSAHGRSLGSAVEAIIAATKAAVFTSPTNPPEAVGAALIDAGLERDVVVVSRIGEDDESVTRTDLQGLSCGIFDPMSVVLIIEPTQEASREPVVRWGRNEEEFEHRDGMITKGEVRAVALGKLAIPSTGVFWDVGAGSGSVGVEVASLAPRLRVIAIERRDTDAERIALNVAAMGVHIETVIGEAPEVLASLPDPDRVFVGGGGIDVLDECIARLRPGGVIVATYVLMDRALLAYERLGNMVQVRVDRCVPLGGVGVRMESLNPIFICWGTA
jgi:precorrin-6Y C5,15-methyltransferase (decarboxylating)